MISQSNTILEKCFRPSSITLFQPALLFPSGVDRRLAVSHFPPGGLHVTQWRRNWAFPLLRHCLAHSPLPVNPRGKAKQQNSCFVAFPPRRLLGGASAGKTEELQLLFPGKNGLSRASAWWRAEASFYQATVSFVQKPALGQFDPHFQVGSSMEMFTFSAYHRCIITTTWNSLF